MLRPNTVQRRKSAMENVIDAIVEPGLFNGSDICGLFHHTDQALISGSTGAVTAGINICDIAAYGAKMKFLFKIANGQCQTVCILGAGAQNVKCQTLGALAANAR